MDTKSFQQIHRFKRFINVESIIQAEVAVRHQNAGGLTTRIYHLAEVAVRHQNAGGLTTRIYHLAEVAELAYAQVSEACPARVVGSTPTFRTFLNR